MQCEKCGKELAENTLVCAYCGHAIPKEKLSQETLNNLEENKFTDESLKPNHNARIRGFGIGLMIVAGICDIISMILLNSSSYGSFSSMTTISTIAFFLGMILTFAFRG